MQTAQPIYLDYNATTPVDPRVREAMLPYLDQNFGNPSSAHAYGQTAHSAVERARMQVAAFLGAHPQEIVFTGGGSEADNLAILGMAFARQAPGAHLVTTAVEHPAVLQACHYLQRRHGFTLTVVGVDGRGRVHPDAIRRALCARTVLVSVMHAQNEVGTLQPLAEIARYTREHAIPLHVDAAQSAGKVAVNVTTLGADMLAIAGHKLYAPKGVGALYIRSGLQLEPLVHGAGQERGRRAGTENVAGVVALGEACALAATELAAEPARLRRLRNLLWARLAAAVPGLRLHGHQRERLPNTLNVGIPDVPAATWLAATPDIAASTGSACHAGRTDPSPVLLAMGLSPEQAAGGVRLSIGRFTTEADIIRAADLLAAAAQRLRANSAATCPPADRE